MHVAVRGNRGCEFERKQGSAVQDCFWEEKEGGMM